MSALPKQRRKCSSNLKVFLIVRSFFACGDGEKARKFAFLEKDKQCRGRVSLHLLASPARLASQTSKSRPARLSSTIYKTSRPRRDGERKIHKKGAENRSSDENIKFAQTNYRSFFCLFCKPCLCRKLKRCTDFPIIEVSFAFLKTLSVQIIKTPHKLPDNRSFFCFL